MSKLTGKPILILKEGSKRISEQDALRVNIAAARTLANSIKSTLGPKGMDKMLVDRLGGIIITNDGATILEEIDVQHPAAKMMVEIARAQDDEVGDGTTTAVIIAGELLRRAEFLLDLKLHPTVIIRGFKKGLKKVKEFLESLSIKVNIDKDTQILKQAAITALNSKSISNVKELFADICVKAAYQVKELRSNKIFVDIERIQIKKRQGKSLSDSELIDGIIIEDNIVHPLMPKKVEDARICILDLPLELEKTKFDAELRFTDPLEMKKYHMEEEEILEHYVQKIKEANANVVFSKKGINDISQHYLLSNNIIGIRRIKKKELEKLAKATGARMVSNIEDLSKDDIGQANLVEEKLVGNKKMIFISGCKDPKAVSILLRGGVDNLIDEAERALNDALCVIRDIIYENKVVIGGGAIEVEIAKLLRAYASSIGDKEQLTIEILADSIEMIPKILAQNAGFDLIDKILKLRAIHSQENNKYYGINVFNGKIEDMKENGVIEPFSVKMQEIKSAVEAASMILRIDDVVAAKLISPEAKAGMPTGPLSGMGGMPPGMGGMPPGM
ncbi:MAG: thermosome subunit [Candidatus Helarchaeota archaeon]|nr:thermosome subunit [Candidatus Helarchaeota archaeon]